MSEGGSQSSDGPSVPAPANGAGDASECEPSASTRAVRRLGLLAGGLLLVIGVRFLIVPIEAQRTFGLPRQSPSAALHAVIGLRDVWLAALALTFAWLKAWRALALWFLMAVPVCLGDGALVIANGGASLAVTFHWVSGVVCAVGGVWAWRLGRATG